MAVISERFDDLGADGRAARLGLMGGTFDPIHIGHLRIAEEVREALSLDAVLFIPTGNPVFKKGQHVTDAHVRLARVRAAVADNPHFDACPLEVDRGGDTYTVDTLRQLRAHYPENVAFYFIVGSDAAQTIGKWRGAREIAELAHLAVAVGRPGFSDADELRDAITGAAPFDCHLVKVSSLEISSSDIRSRLAKGASIRYLVPAAATFGGRGVSLRFPGYAGASAQSESRADANRLGASRAQGDEHDADPLSKRFFKERKEDLKQRVSPKRFKHSLGVSDACVQLAKMYGVDAKKARLAGLLHDWDKGYNDEQARARIYELGMEDEVDPSIVRDMPSVLHGITAARALARDFPEIPSDVLQAIDRHTTAALDMSPLDMVLYIADAIEPNRQFGRIDELRDAVGRLSLEELYFQTYEYWVFLLFERRKPLHPDTIRIWNDYTARRARKKGNHRK